MGVLSGVILALFIASLIIVNLPATAGSLEPHTSIRCAWAPTCSAAHSLTVTSAADPKALRNATRLAEELREDERKLRVRHPQAGEFERGRCLDERMQSLDPAHTIIALGAYGYD
jgi:hypothetical protein